MGGRSSKTKPVQPGVNSQNLDTEVQTFDMDGAVDEVHAESTDEFTASTAAAAASTSVTAAATSSLSSKSSIVQDILDGKADNNLAPLSALYGSKSNVLELQVSSSEDEDDEPDANKKHKRKKSAARKKKKAGADAKSPAKTPVLKPVKPPPHSPNQHTPVEPLARVSSIDASPSNDALSSTPNTNSASEKPPATPNPQDPPATPKADSPSRFFAFSRTRKSFSRPSTSTREREKASVRERSSGSPEKASTAIAPLSPTSPSPPKTGATSLERFMEWREGTYRSSGRESSTRVSEPPSRDELPGTAAAPFAVESNDVEDFDTLERETASALALGASVRATASQSSSRSKSSERRSASATMASPVVSTKSQRSSRSAGRNLNIDDLDENIMNDILAEAIDT